jgi:hypothetical protein
MIARTVPGAIAFRLVEIHLCKGTDVALSLVTAFSVNSKSTHHSGQSLQLQRALPASHQPIT